MKSATAILFMVVAMALTFETSEAIVCTPTSCHTVKCAPPTCASNQVYVPKGGYCGCCDICVTILNEGDSCTQLSGGLPQTERCGCGLQCINGVCTRV